MSWKCSCGLINSAGNSRCADKRKSLEHLQATANEPDFIQFRIAVNSMSILSAKERERLKQVKQHLKDGTNPYEKHDSQPLSIGGEIKPREIKEPIVHEVKSEARIMTEQEQLFQKLYAKGRMLVKDMDSLQLEQHTDELSKIAFEAKVLHIASDDERRERKAKVKPKEWLVTPTDSPASSDAINAVKVRRDRMSKMDKARQDLLKAGIEEETVNEMIRAMEARATATQAKTISFAGAVPAEKIKQIEPSTFKTTDNNHNPFEGSIPSK